jgi:cysteine desulfurase
MRRPVYLDYNATTPVRPAVAAAMAEALAAVGNPSSVHGFGRAARARLEAAREQVAALVGARPAQVVFTSGGTEANDLALTGAGRERVLVTAIEHDSVLKATAAETIPVERSGLLDLAVLERMLAARREPALVAVMLANNETGVIQPVAEAACLVHGHGALLHCDAVQATGKIAVDFNALGADLMTLSAHKLGGPAGVGALVIADHVNLAARQRGGGQERGRRAGTENLAGIVGFGVAAEIAAAELGAMAGLAGLRDDLERRALVAKPGAFVFGREARRLANTSCIALPGVSSELQVMALDLAGVAVSAGSACSSGKVQPSHVLRAMGADAATAGSAIRVSLGWQSTAEDVERFLEAWCALAARRPAAESLTAA